VQEEPAGKLLQAMVNERFDPAAWNIVNPMVTLCPAVTVGGAVGGGANAAAPTVSLSDVEVLPAKLPSPEYCAVMGWEPEVSEEVVNVAWSPLRVPVVVSPLAYAQQQTQDQIRRWPGAVYDSDFQGQEVRPRSTP
jgi:hypothetical protein